MIDVKYSDERDQKSKVYEEKIIEEIEITKLKILSSKIYIYIYLRGESDKINSKDMCDNIDSDKRKQINKKNEVKVSDIVENLKVGKLSSHKYVHNVETESDKNNLVDMSDEMDSVEGDDIHKNNAVTLTDVDQEFEDIDKINRKEQAGS